jgi:hypothetical protein
MDNKQKCISLIAILLALVAISIGGSITTNESIFQIEVNNTNLAPSVAGEPPGTGDRIQGTTYYANNTPIQLFVFGHANTLGQDSEIHLYINGTRVADTSGKPLGVAEQQNRSVTAIIPKFASYKIEANNIHHYEWREYKVISGNSSGSSVASSSDSLKVNKSGDTMTGYLSFAENKGISLIANSSVGGIQRLILLKMTTPYDRPWIVWLDENGRNKVSMGYHTLNAADNATHEDFEMKTSNFTGGDMITRFALGSEKLLVNATFTDIDKFFIRSTSSTIFQFLTESATINVGNGTNTLSKIDFSGSRGQIGYSGSGMIIQSGASKPMEFHVNNSGSPGTASRAISIDVNRNIQLPAYAGTGTRAACFDASGNLVASINATSNYLTC